MNPNQFSHRIGNVEDHLIQQSQQLPGYGFHRRNLRLKRALILAAVVTLMVCSFTVGAMAFSKETVVEVPVGQESVTLDKLGLTLIFPDSWKGQYTIEEVTPYEYHLFINSIREKTGASWSVPGGMLFYIMEIDEVLTPEQVGESEWNFAHNQYLFATQDSTYLLYYASDIEYDWNDPEQETLYRKMESEIREIRIVVDNALA